MKVLHVVNMHTLNVGQDLKEVELAEGRESSWRRRLGQTGQENNEYRDYT